MFDLPSTREDASSIAGWMSLACWIIVYSPQIFENYSRKSGEGLSVMFIVLWLAGDLTNLAGGVMARLLPTMIVLAIYYSACDIVLLFQVYYYRATIVSETSLDETQSLLQPANEATLTPTKRSLSPMLTYPLITIAIIATGLVCWFIQKAVENTQPDHGTLNPKFEWKSQFLGYLSAALYLGSRVPQIAHNYHTRCEGLSLAMFFFSISGNLTYVASILCKSLERQYVLANTSWLIGSGGTVLLDCVVMAQFFYFARQPPTMKARD